MWLDTQAIAIPKADYGIDKLFTTNDFIAYNKAQIEIILGYIT